MVRNIRVSFFFFFVNGRTIIKIVMAKQEKEERLIRDGRISMFVLGRGQVEGEELSCLLTPLNRSRFPFRASSVETRLIFLLKVSVLNGRGQATSIATRFIYAWSCSPSIPRLAGCKCLNENRFYLFRDR